MKLLIVVDYQDDFVDGTLGFPGALALEEPIARKIEAYRETADTVAFTFDAHGEDYLSTEEGRNLPVAHCLKGTSGFELYGRIAELRREEDPIFEKPSFGSADLFQWLRSKQLDAEALGEQPFESIELVGLVSSICVLSNAVIAKTACPDVPVRVDAACTAALDESMNEKTLDILENIHVQVVNR